MGAVPPPTADDERWLRRAVALASANVDEGGGPFGAVVVLDGREVATGQNRVVRDGDPTAHAEILAIRAACRALGSYSLRGATIYSSCEPCPLCLGAVMWSRAARVVYAADRNDAMRAGSDDREFYDLLVRDPATWPTPVVAHRVPGCTEPMERWLALGNRIEY
jgi:guanine deaminase